MIHTVTMPRLGVAAAWRNAARALLSSRIPPDEVSWVDITTPVGLFDQGHTSIQTPHAKADIRVPRSFVSLANSVVWHSDPQRFAHLYALLWKLQDAPQLMADRGDPGLATLRAMEKNVHRCQHKMKAFVRFREIGDPSAPRRAFAAWFEPTHHTVEPTAQFFHRRFADMDWRILTPDVSAIFEAGKLRFVTDQQAPDLPPDAHEDLWVTYFRNIFNPARLKVRAMQSEMPKKYWKNMPEAAAIPDMIATAPARARAMAAAAPSLPPPRMAQVQAMQAQNVSAWAGPASELPQAIQSCTRCPLHKTATQAVPGEGPLTADLMIVGEQPGDQEDLQGRPFVGPAGQVFDTAADRAGLDRSRTYVTNAVKHFKFTPRGKRRIHQRPNTSEINHCAWWLAAERDQVMPKVILAMGATAAQALTGSGANLSNRRGQIETTADGVPVIITYHPSYILRQPDERRRAQAMDLFQSDLSLAARFIGKSV